MVSLRTTVSTLPAPVVAEPGLYSAHDRRRRARTSMFVDFGYASLFCVRL
jgi:hypothetical protein